MQYTQTPAGARLLGLAPCFAIGAVAGLRTFAAPAAVAFAAASGRLRLYASPRLAAVLGLLAAAELAADKSPRIPSRRRPAAFAARLVSGAAAGAALRAKRGEVSAGLLAGGLGALFGTLGGYALRMRLARALGADPPAALLEDALALSAALTTVRAAARREREVVSA